MENTALSVKFGLGFCTKLVWGFFMENSLEQYPFCRQYFWPDFMVMLTEGLNFLCSAMANFRSTKNNL